MPVMSVKLLASADLHLGKKSSGIPDLTDECSVRFTWRRMVNLAVDNDVDAVVLAGDIIDRDNRFFEATGPLQDGFNRLKEAGIAVVMVTGNHDFDVLPDVIRIGNHDHVHLLGEKGRWEIRTLSLGEKKVQFAGWSFPVRHVPEDPSTQQWPETPDPDLPVIGLLHGDLTDTNSKYAPLDIHHLIPAKADVWVLGHIHKPGIYRKHGPLIFYPGSPHALHSGEPGAHGPFLLTLEGHETVSVKHIPLSPVRYETLAIDVSKTGDESDFRNRIIGAMSDDVQNRSEELEQVSRLVYDVILTGHHASLNDCDTWSSFAADYKQEMTRETVVSIRKVVNRVEPEIANLEQLAGQTTPVGMLAQAILDLQANRTSGFTDRLLERFQTGLDEINHAGTYHPLKLTEEGGTAEPGEAPQYLLQECRRLLAALLRQHKTP